MNKRRWLIGISAALVLLWLAVRWANSNAAPGHHLGSEHGRLAPCPDSPNCVSTFATDALHKVEPIHFTGSVDEAMNQLKVIVASLPGSRIVTSKELYLHAEFRSTLLGFVDDLELLVDETANVVHIRSASRVGYADLGVNRQRVEDLHSRFDEQ